MRRSHLKILVLISLLVLVLIPIIIIVYKNDTIQRFIKIIPYKFSQKSKSVIIAESKVLTHTTKIADTGFLDYIFAQLNVFGPGAIVDPIAYRSKTNIKSSNRYTVTRVNIELVPTLNQYLLAIGGKTDFEARGTYNVKDGTLFIQVSLNPNEVPGSDITESYALEDVYLKAAIQTLVYATGSPNSALDMQKLNILNQNYVDYIQSGIFQRPIQINKTNK